MEYQKLFGWFGGLGIKKTLIRLTLKKIPKGGYPLYSGRPHRLWFGMA